MKLLPLVVLGLLSPLSTAVAETVGDVLKLETDARQIEVICMRQPDRDKIANCSDSRRFVLSQTASIKDFALRRARFRCAVGGEDLEFCAAIKENNLPETFTLSIEEATIYRVVHRHMSAAKDAYQ